jgi:hypothetical protein
LSPKGFDEDRRIIQVGELPTGAISNRTGALVERVEGRVESEDGWLSLKSLHDLVRQNPGYRLAINRGRLTERHRTALLKRSQPKGCKCSNHLPSSKILRNAGTDGGQLS